MARRAAKSDPDNVLPGAKSDPDNVLPGAKREIVVWIGF
jgi:hypothetical protein